MSDKDVAMRLPSETTIYVKPNIRAARRRLKAQFQIRGGDLNRIEITMLVPHFAKIATIFELLFKGKRLCRHNRKMSDCVAHGHQTVRMIRWFTM